jgi:methylthioribulose-1-phosphate dehydratase
MTASANCRDAKRSSRLPLFREAAGVIATLGRDFHARGWALGTSGDYSAVLKENPLRLAITGSGLDKSTLAAPHVLEIDGDGEVLRGLGRPSDETRLHLAIIRARAARAVLHTHSVWSTLLSESHCAQAGLTLEGYEMLKGLEGVSTHEHREWLPILDNSQDLEGLATAVESILAAHPCTHGFLLCGHGLYTWGDSLTQAKRHVEILEFLLEVMGRKGFGMSQR